MPLPLFLGIGAAIAGAGGVGAAAHGAVKMKKANDTMKAAQDRHNRNIAAAEVANQKTTESMDQLGKKELEALESFSLFTELLAKIHNRPEFKEYDSENVKLPTYNPDEIRRVSVGAGVLMGGIGGAALGTAGGFAAAGATTAAVMAFGTASTGAAISGLTGIAATNATLAALGGGAIAAGGGGIALGTTILGATTLGVGLLIGGLIFNVTGSSLSKKADEAQRQVLTAEKQLNRIVGYLSELKDVADEYHKAVNMVYRVYRRHLNALDAVVTFNQRTDWNNFTDNEKLLTQNLVLLVQLLYKMCQVKLVIVSEKNDELNTINKAEVKDAIVTAHTLLKERNISA